jgi:hypothetical protein
MELGIQLSFVKTLEFRGGVLTPASGKPLHRAAIQHKLIILFDKLFVIPLALLMSALYQSQKATYSLFYYCRFIIYINSLPTPCPHARAPAYIHTCTQDIYVPMRLVHSMSVCYWCVSVLCMNS